MIDPGSLFLLMPTAAQVASLPPVRAVTVLLVSLVAEYEEKMRSEIYRASIWLRQGKEHETGS